MHGSQRRREAFLVACLATSLAEVTAGAVCAEESRVHLKGAPGMAVRRAIEGALLRLQEPGCQQVFSDFRDGAGRPLQANLDALGVTPEAYVGLLLFYDGSSQRRCTSGEILGGTLPGSRVVYVCPVRFFETDRTDQRATEVFIIHETLHSLGLGENPPAPIEINWDVMARCPGRARVTRGRPAKR
jgi:hypothetical protein